MVSASAFAQNKEKKGARKGSQSEQQARHLAVSMELDEEQTAWFVPLYAAYADSLQAIQKEIRRQPLKVNPTAEELEKAGKKRNAQIDTSKLSAEEAQVLIQRNFEAQEKGLQLKQSYYQIFSARISPKKLLPLFGPMQPGGMRQGGQRPNGYGGQRGGFGGPRGGFGGSFGANMGGGF